MNIVRQILILLALSPSLHGSLGACVTQTMRSYQLQSHRRHIQNIHDDVHECAIDRLQASYEKEILELRQEMKTMKAKAERLCRTRLHWVGAYVSS